MEMKRVNEIDLNADLGEGEGPTAIDNDEALLHFVSSANIACGFHAGDPQTMRRTVEMCIEHGVAIGAHPGLPDRAGFGRREMRVSPGEVANWLQEQIGALQEIAAAAGTEVCHVKPHGALYHMAANDADLAEAIVCAMQSADRKLLLYGPPKSCLEQASTTHGVVFVAEGFADRAYRADGQLVPRGQDGAAIDQPELILSQALSLVQTGSVSTLEGGQVGLAIKTLCLHGDTPHAALHAQQLSKGLRSAGVVIRAPLSRFIPR